jgi:hypothetical protein
MKQLDNIFKRFKNEIAVKDRVYHMRTYKQCFVGSAAVDWLLFNTNALDREEALVLGQEMVNRYVPQLIAARHSSYKRGCN